MSQQRPPEERTASDRTGDSKRSLAMWLAGIALILTILLILFFTWWQREGEETDEDAVTRIEFVNVSSHAVGDYLRSA